MSWTKDKDAVLDYTFDWEKWLNKGDIISSAVFTVEGKDQSLAISGSSFNRKYAVVLLSGGTPDEEYNVKCRIETKDGLVEERDREILIYN